MIWRRLLPLCLLLGILSGYAQTIHGPLLEEGVPVNTGIDIWQHQGTVIGSSAGHNPQQPNVIYESGCIIVASPCFRMWYDDFNGSVGNTSYAESTNGTTFSIYGSNPLIANQGWDKLYKVGSTYYLYTSLLSFAGINVYTSTDGISWTLRQSNAIVKGSAGQWDSSAAIQLSLIDIVGGTWYGYYAGHNATSAWLVGLATSSDGITWTKGSSNPVITVGSGNFDWHKINGRYFGWTQIVLPGIPYNTGAQKLFYPSDMARFSSPSVNGPFTMLPTPTTYRAVASEGPTVFGGQVADPNLVSDGTNLWMYVTASAAGDGEGGQTGPWVINAIKAPSTTFTQLALGYEGIQTFPFPTVAGLALNETVVGADNFQRANENPLTDAGNWTTLGGSPFFVTAQLLSNAATGTTTAHGSIMVWTGAAQGNNQYFKVTVGSAHESGSVVGGVLRGSTLVPTGYILYFNGVAGSPGTLSIACYLNGVFKFGQNKTSYTVNVGDTLTGIVVGNLLSIYHNGFLVFSFTDTNNYIASGSAGLYVYGGPTTATDASITSISVGTLNVTSRNVKVPGGNVNGGMSVTGL